MKLITTQNKVVLDETARQNVTKFNIEFSSKICKILSDGIYSDKILAIVRELSTNAYDAQVESGNDKKPFEVHLPTWTKPIFWIRDYGIGMSPEKVNEIYTTYGASDKEDSNDYVGCLGLGSKTPFCYNSKSFTLETWNNGIHYIYSGFLDEDGLPCLSLMSENPSKEPSGTKISLTTAANDFTNFSTAAQKVYRYFPITPKFHGNNITIPKPKYIYHGTNWALREHDYNGCQLIMGTLAYPVNFEDSSLTQNEKEVMASQIDIQVKLGEVDIGVSREELSYDNRTKLKIRMIIKQVLKDLTDKTFDELDKCKTLWDARLKAVKIFNSMPKNLQNIIGFNSIKWKGKQLFNSYDGVISFQKEVKDHEIEIYCGEFHGDYRAPTKHQTQTVSLKSDFRFFINDIDRGGFGRLLYSVKQDRKPEYLFKCPTPEAKQALVDAFGMEDDSLFENISSIPSPNSGKTGNYTRRKLKNVMLFDYLNVPVGKERCCTYYWKELQKIPDEGIYITLKQFNIGSPTNINQNDIITPHYFNTVLISYIKKLDITVPTIYGIKEKELEDGEYEDWTSFWDWLTLEMEKASKDHRPKNYEQCKAELNNYSYKTLKYHTYYSRTKRSDLVLSIDSIRKIASHTKDTIFNEFVENYNKIEKILSKSDLTQYFNALQQYLSKKIKVDESVDNIDLVKLAEKMMKEYPILHLIDESELQKNPSIFVKHVMEVKKNG